MIKKLESLRVTALLNVEFIELIRDTVTDTTHTQMPLLTLDPPLARYLKSLGEGVDLLEMATRNPKKNPYTELLQQKDKVRDTALSRFGRKLFFYELSDDKDEQKAFNVLNALWKIHRNNASLNYQAQTAATNKFLNDLHNETYAGALSTLGMQPERDVIQITNDHFRILAEDKRSEQAEKDYADAKQVRATVYNTYILLADYTTAMANAYPENKEWDKLLTLLNLLRKRYGEILSRRNAAAKEEEKNGK
jgi:hypothetical protein